ncbi:MAG: hypothetical protein CMJ18_13795 [Phycisphaeraceae bacterium]|nr:hypothetical protein [Phycisphaeraceae bacterium]
MIVDVHTHVWSAPTRLGRAIDRLVTRPDDEPWNRLEADTLTHDQAMEPVQYAFVHGLQCQRAEALVTHEHVAEAVRRHPHRLIGFGGVDPLETDPDEGVDRAIALGLSGITICPSAAGMHPCHSRAMRLYERCERERMPIFVFGAALFGPEAEMAYDRPELYDEVARSFGDLKIVLTRMGRPWIEAAMALITRHRNVFADTSELVTQPWQLYHALVLAGDYGALPQLLYGSGFPFCTPRRAIQNIYSINRFTQGTNLPNVSTQELRNVVERDAIACLGIAPPPRAEAPEPVIEPVEQVDISKDVATATTPGAAS